MRQSRIQSIYCGRRKRRTWGTGISLYLWRREKDMAEVINTFKDFDVTNHIKTNPATGKQFIKHSARIRWFRSVYPMGKIEANIVATENDRVTAEARVYAEDTREEHQFLANATATRIYDPGDPYGNFPNEWARTAAINKALIEAGFTIPELDDVAEGEGGEPNSGNGAVPETKANQKQKESPVMEYSPKPREAKEAKPNDAANGAKTASASQTPTAPTRIRRKSESKLAKTAESPDTNTKQNQMLTQDEPEELFPEPDTQESSPAVSGEAAKPAETAGQPEESDNQGKESAEQASETAPEANGTETGPETDEAEKPDEAGSEVTKNTGAKETKRGGARGRKKNTVEIDSQGMTVEEAMNFKFTKPADLQGKTFREVLEQPDEVLLQKAGKALTWYRKMADNPEYAELAKAATVALRYLGHKGE